MMARQIPGGSPRWVRFALSGTSNTAVDLAVFAALLRWSDLGPFAANLCAFGTAVCCSFLLNRFWTFGDRRGGSLVAFVLWMSAIALLSSWLLDRAIRLGLEVAVAKVSVTALVVVLSYFAMNVMVFRPDRQRAALAAGMIALFSVAGLCLAAAGGGPRGMPKDLLVLYSSEPAPPVNGPLRVYHLGHSLVGRDMPAMVAQLAGEGHHYALQLGWGTTLSQHLAGPDAIAGFASENATPRYLPLSEVLSGQAFDALVFTEMIGLREAIRYHDSPKAVADLARRARAANINMELLLYETWHPLDEGDWLIRIDEVWDSLWQPFVLAPAVRATGAPVRVVPAGTAMARLVAEVEATPGGVGGMTGRADLFSDMIHLSDLGTYTVALTHYAALYRRSPEGLPHRLLRADGTPAEAPTPELAALMQRIVWETVRASPLSR